MKYIQHVDGLRALAILPVVAYHADIPGITGGFTGVDIFFVISGYLIVSIITNELRNNNFSLATFYKRRALRILPAYVAMIMATIIGAYLLFLPAETHDLGYVVAAASGFVSNIFYWQEIDYFNPSSDIEPLIHTWSLSVEEQFYVFIPITLLLVSRYLGMRFQVLIGIVTALSFVLCLWVLTKDKAAAFYLLPTRVWEFGLGAMLGITGLKITQQKIRLLFSLIGLGLIGYGFFGLNAETSFPGPNALYPTLGAVLLIGCAEGTWVSRALSTTILVFVGKISYSLYLWHWPIITFYKHRFGPDLDLTDTLTVIILSLIVSYMSYLFIERPFRTNQMREKKSIKVNAPALLCLVCCIFGGLIVSAVSETWRNYPEDVKKISAYSTYQKTEEWRSFFGSYDCMIHSGTPGHFKGYPQEKCLKYEKQKPNYLLLGDSHAGHLLVAFAGTFKDVNIQQAAASGCRPTIEITNKRWCGNLMRLIFNKHIPNQQLDGIILSARWLEKDIPNLVKTVNHLSSYVENIIILGPTVEYKTAFPTLLARSLITNGKDLNQYLDPNIKKLDQQMQETNWAKNARYISLYNLICPNAICIHLTSNNIPYHFDYGHYTLSSAYEITEKLQDLNIINANPKKVSSSEDI